MGRHGHTHEKVRNYGHGYAKWSAGSNRQYHSTWATLPVILPNQSHKHLGMHMVIQVDDNFLAEKEHVRSNMEQRLNTPAKDRVLTQKEKERVITTAVC